MSNPEYRRDISRVAITVDHTFHTVDVEYNDIDDWNNMITCVLGLGVVYNRCVNQGYPEQKVYEGMITNLMTAIANFRSTPPGKNGGNGNKPVL